ncbi:MAG: hypothetical protein JW809_04185 [Pirellulales bacterium]|nr:hypothetical protein [Pirellulales bacterium]
MNYLAHAIPFLDEPYRVAGAGVPDMLVVVDRRVRLRSRHVRPFLDDPDPVVAAVAGGIAQHFRDDARFHETAAFARLSNELAVASAAVLGDAAALRPRFVGHLLVELLLDATLAEDRPDLLERYYRAIEAVDARRVQEAVNQMAPQPTDRLAAMISLILRERFLSDYLEDAKLWVRLNQIMRRVRLEPLPEGFREILPDARRRVRAQRDALLEGIPVPATGE